MNPIDPSRPDPTASPEAPERLPGEPPADAWPDDATHDVLVGRWRLWQRRGGHRTSTDDLLTAWLAADTVGPVDAADAGAGAAATRVANYVDIGCGIGSVMLMTAHALRPRSTLGVEAQAQSAAMARRSVAELPPGAPPIEVVHADLRDWAAAASSARARFDLVTGSPPYFPDGTGVPSPDAQRRACRFELRGGVEAYAQAAAQVLAPGGWFCLVFQTQWADRVEAAFADAELAVRRRVDVFARADQPRPFLTVWAASDTWGDVDHRTWSVRDAGGEWTEEYRAARATLGLGV